MQASFWAKQFPHLLPDLRVNRFKYRVLTTIPQKRVRKITGWLLGSTSLTLMVAWNWKLVLATSTGIGCMVLVYRIQSWNWQSQWVNWREFFGRSQGRLIIAVGSGSFAVLGTYIAASIWSEAENRWLATGAIIQAIGTLLTLGLLLWQIGQLQDKKDESQLNQWLSHLTDPNPLKRLMAVRHLSTLLQKQQQIPPKQLWEYFRLMLTQEQEPLVRQAIVEGLEKSIKG